MEELQEKESIKGTATEDFLRGVNPLLWQGVVSLSSAERDKRWFDLTQSHLKDYEVGKIETEKFKQEELEFLYLNYLATKDTLNVDFQLKQRGFCLTAEKGRERFKNFEDFIGSVLGEVEKHMEKVDKPFWVLVGGIGISGKATLRTLLTKELTEKLPQKKVTSWDRDYQKIFPPLWTGDINLIEDVHGLDKGLSRFDGPEGLVGGYDVVVYALSPTTTYRESLLRRGLSWLKAGKMDLTAPGEQYPTDPKERMRQTAQELERTLQIGSEWFKEQLKVLRELKKRGVTIIVVDPTEIFKKIYGFEEKHELSNQPFLKTLEENLNA